MIKKENRLKKSRYIKRCFDKGKGINTPFFKLRSFKRIDRAENAPSRIAVILSKKFSKLAVKRNLARRRIQAAFREDLKNCPGFDIVILPNRRVLECDFSDLQGEAKKCLDILR